MAFLFFMGLMLRVGDKLTQYYILPLANKQHHKHERLMLILSSRYGLSYFYFLNERLLKVKQC